MMARKVGRRDPLWARLVDERDHTMSMPKALLLAVLVELLLFGLLWLAFMNMNAKPDDPPPMIVTLEQLEPEKKLEGEKPHASPKKETPKPQPPKPVEPSPPKVEEKVKPKPPQPQPEPKPEPVWFFPRLILMPFQPLKTLKEIFPAGTNAPPATPAPANPPPP